MALTLHHDAGVTADTAPPPPPLPKCVPPDTIRQRIVSSRTVSTSEFSPLLEIKLGCALGCSNYLKNTKQTSTFRAKALRL